MAPPTKSGYYWLRTTSRYATTGKILVNRPEIVHVVMEYTFRRKVVPFIISGCWRGPLADMKDEDCEWSEEITSPFKETQ
jgi:hypothetical protein